VLGTACQYASSANDQNVRKLGPILVVTVDDKRDSWILPDVSKPFQLSRRDAFRFLVDGRVKIIAVEDKADRDDVRLAVGAGGCQMGDAGGADEGQFLLC